jgi:hypothetical protein
LPGLLRENFLLQRFCGEWIQAFAYQHGVTSLLNHDSAIFRGPSMPALQQLNFAFLSLIRRCPGRIF